MTGAVSEGLEGAVAIVTGAAGGLGRAIVERLHAAGARIVAEDIAPEVDELEREDGTVVALRGDVSLAETAARAVELARSRLGGLDLLVNNAGRIVFRSLTDTTDEDFDGLMATNARGTFVHCRAAMPALESSPRGGAVVNVASISGVVGLADQCAYSATKGAIVQITRALAIEYGGRVRVNAVAPGAIRTPLLVEPLRATGDLEGMLRLIDSHHPMGRMSEPAEIAEVVAFLASPRAGFLTGSIVAADGGYTAA